MGGREGGPGAAYMPMRPDEGQRRKSLRVTNGKFPERAGKKPAAARPMRGMEPCRSRDDDGSGIVFGDGFGRFPIRLIVHTGKTAIVRLVFLGLFV